jgi:short-subunit dehydrogenase
MAATSAYRMSALITGASSGIGLELAWKMAEASYDLILVARRREKLEELAQQLSSKFLVTVDVVEMDLSIAGAASELLHICENLNLEFPRVVVNNAGFGMHGPVVEQSVERLGQMIQLNVQHLSENTQFFANAMKEKGLDGVILNVASLVAFFPTPYMAAYAASKSYVRSFSRAADFELKEYGIRVLALCPGTVMTEFFDVAGTQRMGFIQRKIAITPKQAAAAALKMIRRRRVQFIPGFLNRMMRFFTFFLPESLVVRFTGKLMK